ncbi:MAG: hypothetical protein LAT64_12960 [Phycisphaerales bacterium]|nr:hypothetical protein [Planctomycetota bacterium]MCH8509665.1 hypothetical protein [Phycisphaerales bacterium]
MPPLDLANAEAVIEALRAGADANRTAACRTGSIDRVEAPGRLIATGDIHDNPINFATVVAAAGLDAPEGEEPADPAHLTLHEIIHPPTLVGGMDFSYRGLTRVAALKARFPGFVHTLLANHELAQVYGAGIVKNGVRVVDAFNAGVEYVFGEDADAVQDAIKDFVLSMPLALRCVCPQGDILCAHSLPAAANMARFDPTIINRDLTEDDYQPRSGSAYFMVWGRGYDAELLEDLTERWGVNLFILGHEHADHGYALVEPNALVLNTDHEQGVYLPIDLSSKPRLSECPAMVVPVAGG